MKHNDNQMDFRILNQKQSIKEHKSDVIVRFACHATIFYYF